ncbi:hypothetical protein [Rubrivivax rivuli]|uniref:hypothetical protein n=1 Tax=Rubrivivax rivuli TaxID=1862385 RepID=UPI0013E36397|nr:hypothetical protein [Rubrivivax rivuli]
MKFNITTAIVGVGIVALLLAAHRKQTKAAPTTHNSETATSPGQWWSYAGAWSGRT